MEPLRLLVYAKWGTGKTRLAATAAAVPELSPVVLWSFDKTTASIDKELFKLEIIEINTGAQLEAAFAKLIVNNQLQYRTVIIDTITELHAMMMSEAMKGNLAVAKAKGREKSAYVPEPLDYNGAQNGVLIVLRKLRDLGLGLIVTAQDSSIVDGTGQNEVELYAHAPRTAKKCSLIIPEFFQLVAYGETPTNGEFTLDFNKSRSIVKDTRGVITGGKVVSPTVQKIYSLYIGKGGKTAKPTTATQTVKR